MCSFRTSIWTPCWGVSRKWSGETDEWTNQKGSGLYPWQRDLGRPVWHGVHQTEGRLHETCLWYWSVTIIMVLVRYLEQFWGHRICLKPSKTKEIKMTTMNKRSDKTVRLIWLKMTGWRDGVLGVFFFNKKNKALFFNKKNKALFFFLPQSA